jgi:hypothetical protein
MMWRIDGLWVRGAGVGAAGELARERFTGTFAVGIDK